MDTPGLGSVFAGNTAATQPFVPHIDAAIVVVGADPPISGEELALVEEVGKQVHDVLVVMNKADRTSDEDREIAKSFTSNSWKSGSTARRSYLRSQRRGAARKSGTARDWALLVEALKSWNASLGAVWFVPLASEAFAG